MTHSKRLTGEQLFLRYAYPCVEIRRQRGLISPEDAAELDRLVKTGGEPTRELLARCFPNACKSLRVFARHIGLPMWDFRTVATYWRLHHGHTGLCAVRRTVVSRIDRNGLMTVVNGSGDQGVVNPYHLPIAIGQTVFVHQLAIIEVACEAD